MYVNEFILFNEKNLETAATSFQPIQQNKRYIWYPNLITFIILDCRELAGKMPFIHSVFSLTFSSFSVQYIQNIHL